MAGNSEARDGDLASPPSDFPEIDAGRTRPSERARFPFVPRLRLFGETVVLDEGGREVEAQAAVGRLEFVYAERVFAPGDDDGLDERDTFLEAEAQRIVEAFGVVEFEYVEGCLLDFDSEANFLVALASAPHSGVSFAAHAVVELRRAGFEVIVDRSFPFQLAAPATPELVGWIEERERDWFSVKLGIEIDGEPHDLVPALIALLSQAAEGQSFESLANCPARLRAVRLADGRYVAIPWERLRKVLAVLAEMYDPTSVPPSLDLPLGRLAELLPLEEAFRETGAPLAWTSGKEWVERARGLADGPKFVAQPVALRATLRPYQHEGLMWLEHVRDLGVGGVLADDMGLGKTLQTIALLAREKEARRMDLPSLIVAPTSLVDNWKREFSKFAPHLRVLDYVGSRRSKRRSELSRAEVVVTSYPILIRDVDYFGEGAFHYAILDEAQAIKNPRSLASHAARSLTARHRLAITGTPVENNLLELWSLFEFVLPGLLGGQTEFRAKFRDPIEVHASEERLELLRRRVRPFILRRVKEEVARDLPEKTELVRSVELHGAQRDLYESIRLAADSEVRSAIAERGVASSSIKILDALMKLRQVCCDPRLVRVESAREVKTSAKYLAFFELLGAQLGAGRRVLVFSQFTQMLALLEQGLRERGIDSLTLTGQSSERQALVDRFERGEADVFLISLKAGGTGLNLVSADTVIHYDPWWNAAAQMQATDRAYRIGQKKPVFVYNLIAASSVEERMLALQQRKRHLATAILGSGGGGLGALSETEIESLFSPLEGDDALDP